MTPKIKNQKSSYRQRGYVCKSCKNGTLVFGNAEPPEACPSCQVAGQLIKDWDHLVTQTTVVADYLENK